MFVNTFQADCVTAFLLYYATYALKDFYNIKENVAALIGNISAISGFIKLTFIFVGPINEIYGRRKPLVFAYIFQTLGVFIYPLGITWPFGYSSAYSGYLLASIFTCIGQVGNFCPFVPDLFKEES